MRPSTRRRGRGVARVRARASNSSGMGQLLSVLRVASGQGQDRGSPDGDPGGDLPLGIEEDGCRCARYAKRVARAKVGVEHEG
jgi:hypothetical protein